jgi:hypothetical protein
VNINGSVHETDCKIVYLEQSGGNEALYLKHVVDDSVKVVKEAINGLSQRLRDHLDAPVSILKMMECYAIQLIA